jgi:mannose-6-phosphate isomerase-like protein (cupin superfamily)
MTIPIDFIDSALSNLLDGLRPRAARWSGVVRPDGPERDAIRIYRSEDADAWLIAWPAHHWTTPHDHGASSAAFTVISGELRERTPDGVRALSPGAVTFVAPGAVHDVGTEATTALSLHVYSPPLTTMNFLELDTARS